LKYLSGRCGSDIVSLFKNPDGDPDPFLYQSNIPSAAAAPATTGNLSQLATYLIGGTWAWDGQTARHRAIPIITYNLGDLTTAERAPAIRRLPCRCRVSRKT
jgi:hypothetical protein